ncbi:MAG: helix-turn-helix transcriptional regulator [Phocaeicola sp.]
MNSLIVKHILFLILIRIPLSVFPALPAKDAESHKTALMSLYIQAKQNPKVTLPRLDSLEKTKTYSKEHIDFFRSCSYHALSKYYMAMYYAQRVVQYQDSRRDTLLMKSAYMLLAESSVAAYHLEDAVRYIDEGKQYAGLVGDPVLEANMMLMEGEVYRRLGMIEKGYQSLRRAISLLSSSVNGDELYCRSRIMGYFMMYCIEDRRMEEAWRVGLKREEVIGKLQQIASHLSGIGEQQAYLYSKMAFLAQRLGKQDRAADYLEKFKQTPMASTVQGRLEINDYLLERGDYQLVLRHVDEYMNSVDEKDSLNIIYIRTLYQTSKAYQGVGNYKSAYEELLKLRQLMEVMRISSERSNLFNLTDFTRVMRQEYELRQAENKLHVRNWVIVGLVVVALALIALLVRIYSYWKVIREKNRKMASLIVELNDKNKEVLPCVTEPVAEVPVPVEVPAPVLVEEQPEVPEETPVAGEAFPSFNPHEIFRNFDAQVREERMYLNYQFSRDDYAALMGVDRNRFAAILKEYTHGNLSAYLNNLRLDYSVGLFRAHPEWSVSEIASHCALPSLSTFYRLFKEKYGMSPNAFRSNLAVKESASLSSEEQT